MKKGGKEGGEKEMKALAGEERAAEVSALCGRGCRRRRRRRLCKLGVACGMLARRGAGKDTYSMHYTYDDDVDDRCIDVQLVSG